MSINNEARAKEFLRRFYATHSKRFFTKLDDNNRGLYIILHTVADRNGEVSPGDIANFLHMSTPRVAAALNVLEKKGQIERRESELDRRKTVLCITDTGRAEVAKSDEALIELVNYVIDRVGENDIDEFLRIAGKIHAALETAAGSTD